MLDDCALRKFWLHSVPQGRVRYFEIVLSALKRDRKKPHKNKNVRQDKTTAVSDYRNTILVGLQKRSSQIEHERFFNGVTGGQIAPERIHSPLLPWHCGVLDAYNTVTRSRSVVNSTHCPPSLSLSLVRMVIEVRNQHFILYKIVHCSWRGTTYLVHESRNFGIVRTIMLSVYKAKNKTNKTKTKRTNKQTNKRKNEFGCRRGLAEE
jgi:hypothetical protein